MTIIISAINIFDVLDFVVRINVMLIYFSESVLQGYEVKNSYEHVKKPRRHSIPAALLSKPYCDYDESIEFGPKTQYLLTLACLRRTNFILVEKVPEGWSITLSALRSKNLKKSPRGSLAAK